MSPSTAGLADTSSSSSVSDASTTVSSTAAMVTEMVTKVMDTSLPDMGSLVSGNDSGADNGTDHTYRSSTFIQTVAGEGIAGVCVWAAILITCHQIYQYLRLVENNTA